MLQGGAAFTAGYMVLVLVNAFRRPPAPVVLLKRVSKLSEAAALSLAVCSLLLAFAALGPVPGDLISNPLAVKEMLATLAVVFGGVVLALSFSRQPLLAAPISEQNGHAIRRKLLKWAGAFESLDRFARRWPVAALALFAVGACFWTLFSGTPEF